MKSELTIDERGNQRWYLNGKLHREDGPAIEYCNNGDKYWLIEGRPHRTDGPATVWSDGSYIWSVNGETHRIDGPAMYIKSMDHEIWFYHGVLYEDVDDMPLELFFGYLKWTREHHSNEEE